MPAAALRCLLLLGLLLPPAALHAQGTLHRADLGRCPLDGGAVLDPCLVGYRTFGTLDAGRTNAILFPTWFTGTSEQLIGQLGDGGLVDTTRFFVVLVDALGNGVSTSPSNSPTQAGEAFPTITIGDMVRAQARLATEVLGLERLHAVMGISMGGMQALHWMVAYPDRVDRVVSIVGTPAQTGADRLLWTAQLEAIDAIGAIAGGEAAEAEVLEAVAAMQAYALTTPAHLAAMPPEAFHTYLADQQSATLRFDAYDRAAQLRAMLAHDIYAATGLTPDTIADRVRARVLIVVARQDHMVNPAPALALASQIDAATLVLPGPCGHLAPGCEGETMRPVVRAFLER